MAEVSFFEHDLANRVFNVLRMGSQKKHPTILRILFAFGITWLPLLLLSLLQGVAAGRSAKESFLYDFAAYGQFFIGVPLFILAEPLLGRMLDEAAEFFKHSGLVAENQLQAYEDATDSLEKYRSSMWPELVIVALSLIMSGMWIMQETSDGISTWHALIGADGREHFTLAGLWVGFVAVPVYQFFLLRWVWKIVLWIAFLWRMSRLNLKLNVMHPDKAGGLGFLGTVQGGFGILVFAEGCVIAATIGYKLVVSGNPATALGVWGPILGFIVVAPILFLFPLLFFTKRLFQLKEAGVYKVAAFSGLYMNAFHEKWLSNVQPDPSTLMGTPDIQSLAAMTAAYDTAHGMKIVPFDLKSVAQLLVAAAGPMLPFASRFLPEEVLKIISEIFGGH